MIMLGTEFALLFFGVPLLIFFDPKFIHPSMLILPLLVFIFLVLRYTTDFKFSELVRLRIGKQNLRRNAVILLACSLVMLAFLILFEPQRLFDLIRGNFTVWLILCIFYPVFSAYGQEIIYRTFLFRRYTRLFGSNRMTVFASAISFSFLHIVYYSPISIILTLFAGLYLAQVYSRTRSVLFTAILHGILGIMVFTLGLGEYFWLDMYDWIGK